MKLIQKIEELYNNKKSKKFVEHLIRAFLPFTNAFERSYNDYNDYDANDKKMELRCCITRKKLYTKGDIVEHAQENMDDMYQEWSNYMQSLFSNKIIDSTPTIDKFQQLLKNRPVALGAPGTDKVMSYDALIALVNFVANRVAMNDKNIMKLVNQKPMALYLEEQKRKDKLKVKGVSNNRSTFNMGSIPGFSDLKDSLED